MFPDNIYVDCSELHDFMERSVKAVKLSSLTKYVDGNLMDLDDDGDENTMPFLIHPENLQMIKDMEAKVILCGRITDVDICIASYYTALSNLMSYC